MEQWVPIPGHPPYEISDLGRVRGYKGILKPDVMWQGYIRARIDGKNFRVHQLVATAFHGPKPSPLHIPNHKDGNKANNCASNLEWVTRRQNIDHASANRLLATAAQGAGGGRLTREKAREIRRLSAEGISNMKLAPQFGVSPMMISFVVRGMAWRE